MEVTGVDKAFMIQKSTGADFHGFAAAVNAFGGAITRLQDDGIQDFPQVTLDGFCHVFDWIAYSDDVGHQSD